MEMSLIEITALASPIVAVTMAVGGTKWASRQNAKDIEAVKANLKEHEQKSEVIHKELLDRTARMETKLDMLVERH